MSHHDVVDGGEDWKTDPFKAVVNCAHIYEGGGKKICWKDWKKSNRLKKIWSRDRRGFA